MVYSVNQKNPTSFHGTCVLLLVLVCIANVRSYKDEPLPDPKIVIMGATGAGKSSLANVFIGASPDCKNCTFPICPGGKSCTKETTYAVDNWLGDGDLFTVVDTPGFGDSENDDNELIDEMVDVLKHQVNTTNTFLLTFNSEDRINAHSTQQMIREMEALFGYSFWQNVVLEASFWAYDQKSIDDREWSGENETWWCNDTNTNLKELYHFDFDLNCVFVDSYAKHGPNLDDDLQQEAFNRETAKLWNYTINNPPFAFRTLEDVLAELDECKRTVEDDITEIFAELEIVKKNFTDVEANLSEESFERKMNDDILNSELAGNITVLQENMTQFEKQVEEEMSKIKTSPVGTIVAWITKPEQDAENEIVVLPEGWVYCDGNPIPEPSQWAGAHTPNLNGDKRFLRGGNYVDQLKEEEDTLQDHTHDDDTDWSHPDGGHTHGYRDYVTTWGDKYSCKNGQEAWGPNHPGSDKNDDRYDCELSSTSHTAYASIPEHTSEIGGVSNSYSDKTVRYGDETKPKNMNVQWIMRVW